MKKVTLPIIIALLIVSAILFIGCPSNAGTSNSSDSSEEEILDEYEGDDDRDMENDDPYGEEAEIPDNFEEDQIEPDSLEQLENESETM